MSVPSPSRSPTRAAPPPDRRSGEVVELTMLRDAHAFLAGRSEPVWYRRGTRVVGPLVRVNENMRRIVVALPEGLATFQQEDVEAA